VPLVEHRIPHGGGHIAHHAEGLQVLAGGIVGVRDEGVAIVVQITILGEEKKD